MVDMQELDPRNAERQMRANVPIYTDKAADVMIARAFSMGGCFGFVMGLIAAALFFTLEW